MTQMRKAKGSTTPVRFPTFDSPVNHGWNHYKLDDDGVVIWELRIEHKTIAALKPCLDKNGCNVAILREDEDPEWFEFNNLDYEYITGEVKRIHAGEADNEDDKIFAEAMHWDGDPEDCQPEPPESPVEYYGLMGVR